MNNRLALPDKVLLVDVSPRDGLQNEKASVSTDDKIALVNALSHARVPRVEVTSFVSPKAVPQMADAEAVMAGIERVPGTQYACLVANQRGLQRAVDAAADIVNFVLITTETFNRRNAGMSVAESMAAAKDTFAGARAAGLEPTAVIGASFHCPFEGRVPIQRVLDLVKELAATGYREITLADTNGKADPAHVWELTTAARETCPSVSLGIHLHDTRGMGLANALAFLQAGGERIEASLGGIGGCPFAPGATGNACTEDLVFMLESMGVSTGVSLEGLVAASRRLGEVLGRTLESRQLQLAQTQVEAATPG